MRARVEAGRRERLARGEERERVGARPRLGATRRRDVGDDEPGDLGRDARARVHELEQRQRADAAGPRDELVHRRACAARERRDRADARQEDAPGFGAARGPIVDHDVASRARDNPRVTIPSSA